MYGNAPQPVKYPASNIDELEQAMASIDAAYVQDTYVRGSARVALGVGLVEVGSALGNEVYSSLGNIACVWLMFTGAARVANIPARKLLLGTSIREARRIADLDHELPTPMNGDDFYDTVSELTSGVLTRLANDWADAEPGVTPSSDIGWSIARSLSRLPMSPSDRAVHAVSPLVALYRGMWRSEDPTASTDKYTEGIDILDAYFPSSEEGGWTRFVSRLANDRDYAEHISRQVSMPSMLTFGHHARTTH